MTRLKHIVLFGAGKSATVLIDYLKQEAAANKWMVTVADNDVESAKTKVGNHPSVVAEKVNIENENERKSIISKADIVISLLPPALHYFVAIDSLALNKNLLTASYISDEIKLLEKEIKNRQLLFLCEMGLDPGIDHMSAMQLFNSILSKGGNIISFKSHCGGLIAPESDNNPWHYKISWNPRNIVLAGKSGAVFKENGKEVHLDYEKLFNTDHLVKLPTGDVFAYYPNRDSLKYIDLYNLQNIETFIRTTLRHPEFCFGWKNIVDIKLTDETKIYDTNGMSIATFFKMHFIEHGFTEWLSNMLANSFSYAEDMMEKIIELEKTSEENVEIPGEIMTIDDQGLLNEIDVDEIKGKAAKLVAYKIHEANLSMSQLFFLGLDDETLINKGLCSAADVLQFILENKLALEPGDKDMIVMMHEIEYEINKKRSFVSSSLVIKGEDHLRTAMAKTVGLPLGIAAKLILEKKIQETGLHIPIIQSVYEPVLKELENYGIKFHEEHS